jgi:hypothetical protein
VRTAFDATVVGLLAATVEVLPDLKKSGSGAILVSNGAFGEVSAEADEAAVNLHAMGIALSSADKNKLVGLLAQRLKGDGIYVGGGDGARHDKGHAAGRRQLDRPVSHRGRILATLPSAQPDARHRRMSAAIYVD